MRNCLFELAYNLETPEKMKNWLELEGFEGVNIITYRTENRIYPNAIWRSTKIPYHSNMSFLLVL